MSMLMGKWRLLLLLPLAAVLLLAAWTAGKSVQVSTVFLPAGESILACANGQPVSLAPPDRAICPVATPTPTRTATPTIPATATPVVPPGGRVFTDTLNTSPATPAPFDSPNWQVSVHSRDQLYTLDSMAAQHDPACGPPPATHHHNSFEAAVFSCRNHLMSAIHATGYGVICMTPRYLLDLSGGPAVINWRMSTFRTNQARDWVDVWITPFADHLQLPLQAFYPDLQGAPRQAILIKLQNTRNTFEVFQFNNFHSTQVAKGWTEYQTVLDYESDDQAMINRVPFQVAIGNGRIKVELLAEPVGQLDHPGLTFIDAPLVHPAGWDRAVVQFCHHAYNGWKDGGAGPNTYHWDDFRLSPVTPYTLIEAAPRYAQSTRPILTLAQPSPAGGYLYFSGRGSGLSFSTNGGQSWTVAHQQPGSNPRSDHFASYRTPLPAGVTSIQFRGAAGWHVRDAFVLSP